MCTLKKDNIAFCDLKFDKKNLGTENDPIII